MLSRYLSSYFKKLINISLSERDRDHSLTYNPFKINFSLDASMATPFKIDRGFKIFVKQNSFIGKNAWLAFYGNSIESNTGIFIGEKVIIGNYSCITAINSIEIGNGCLISEYFYTSDHTHGFDPTISLNPVEQSLYSKGKVVIGNQCFIGYRVTILSGVVLGNNCVVGAHSVVTNSFPDHSMIAGSPARLIKYYSFDQKCWISV